MQIQYYFNIFIAAFLFYALILYYASKIAVLNLIYINESNEDFSDHFLKENEDNITLDEENIIKIKPLYGCNNHTRILIGVRTIMWNFDDRNKVRSTWGNIKNLNYYTKLIFLIGNVTFSFKDDFQVREKRTFEILGFGILTQRK